MCLNDTDRSVYIMNKCKICGKQFQIKRGLTNHITRIHNFNKKELEEPL